MARILITGAYGFIGRHLARFLAAQGHLVSGLGHGIWSPIEASFWGVADWVSGDVTIENLRVLQMRSKPEFIFHLAGGSTVSSAIANPREDFFRTVVSTVELLEWIRQDMPRVRLIAISSAAVYGSDKSGPIPVDSSVTPLSPYAHHKRMMELLCSSYGTTYGVEFCVARLFSVYGPGLKKQLLWDICERLSSGESPLVLGGTGQELRDWTHISDVVAALALIAFKYFSSNKAQTINIGTSLGITVREISQLVIDRWQKKMGAFTKPDLQFSGQHRPGDPFSLVSDSLYLSQIGFSWQMPLTHGVHSFVDWFCKEKIS